jgi:hypothetical protein
MTPNDSGILNENATPKRFLVGVLAGIRVGGYHTAELVRIG